MRIVLRDRSIEARSVLVCSAAIQLQLHYTSFRAQMPVLRPSMMSPMLMKEQSAGVRSAGREGESEERRVELKC